MKLKWAACYIVLNEIDYLESSLLNVLPLVAQICIIEGAYEFAWFTANKDGLSKDRTTELIHDYAARYNKISYLPLGKVRRESELRNAYLDMLHDDIEVMWVVDGDEMWLPDEIKDIDEILANSDYDAVYCPHYMFWQDMHHLLKADIKGDPNWRDGCYKCMRIFKRKPLFHYVTDGLEKQVTKPFDIGIPKLLHFGWARRIDKLLEKCLYTLKREIVLHPDNPGIRPFLSCKSNEELKWEILLQNRLFTNEYPSYEWVEKYEGEYPLEARQHPWFHLSKKELMGDNDYSFDNCFK